MTFDITYVLEGMVSALSSVWQSIYYILTHLTIWGIPVLWWFLSFALVCFIMDITHWTDSDD